MKESYTDMNYQQILADWDCQSPRGLDAEYDSLRNDITALWKEVKNGTPDGKKYSLDLKFGIKLKVYFDDKKWFNLRLAADIDFWRYLSVCIVPDLVYERWGGKSEDHFWKKPSRIWLRSIWWFAYLGWKNDATETYELLKGDMFNTDIILGTVERTGRKGTPIKVYKTILHTYAKIPVSRIQDFSSSAVGKSDTLYRSVMRLNTAKIIVVEPELYEGGVVGYVNGLFGNLGVELDDSKGGASDDLSAAPPVSSVAVPDIVIVDYVEPYETYYWRGFIRIEIDINNKTLNSDGWSRVNKPLSDTEAQKYIDFFSDVHNLEDFFDDTKAHSTNNKFNANASTYSLTISWKDRSKSIRVGLPIPFKHPF